MPSISFRFDQFPFQLSTLFTRGKTRLHHLEKANQFEHREKTKSVSQAFQSSLNDVRDRSHWSVGPSMPTLHWTRAFPRRSNREIRERKIDRLKRKPNLSLKSNVMNIHHRIDGQWTKEIFIVRNSTKGNLKASNSYDWPSLENEDLYRENASCDPSVKGFQCFTIGFVHCVFDGLIRLAEFVEKTREKMQISKEKRIRRRSMDDFWPFQPE